MTRNMHFKEAKAHHNILDNAIIFIDCLYERSIVINRVGGIAMIRNITGVIGKEIE